MSQGVLDLFSDYEEPLPQGDFMVYAHTLNTDPQARSLHDWDKVGGNRPTLEEAILVADGLSTHAVVLNRGPIVYNNLKKATPKFH